MVLALTVIDHERLVMVPGVYPIPKRGVLLTTIKLKLLAYMYPLAKSLCRQIIIGQGNCYMKTQLLLIEGFPPKRVFLETQHLLS